METVEAADAASTGCGSASPSPTLRAGIVLGAHTHAHSVERTARMLTLSPLIFSRRAYAVSLMRLCSTRVWLRSASGLKAATRRLSCTTRRCNRLHRAPRVGARRIRCRCWQVLPSGCQRSHPVWQDFYNSGERPPLCDIRISPRSCWRACFNGAHEQACVRRAGSRLWHAPKALACRKVCVHRCVYLRFACACVVGACSAGKSQLRSFQRYRGL